MLKPAGSRRKPKPDLIWRTSRLAATFCARPTRSATTTSATAPCSNPSRSRRARRRARHAASPVAAADTGSTLERTGQRSSANRRRVHQPALGPQVVDAARQAEGRLEPEVSLEALAVVADLLDDAVGPLGVESQKLARVLGDAEEALHGRIP